MPPLLARPPGPARLANEQQSSKTYVTRAQRQPSAASATAYLAVSVRILAISLASRPLTMDVKRPAFGRRFAGLLLPLALHLAPVGAAAQSVDETVAQARAAANTSNNQEA